MASIRCAVVRKSRCDPSGRGHCATLIC